MNKYVAYLNTYYNRPCTAQLLWWYYYLIDHLPNTHLILNYDYEKISKNRWEYAQYKKAPYEYSDPKNLSPKYFSIMKRFEEYPELEGIESPTELTRRSITTPVLSIVNEILEILEKQDNITAGISWVNNASFDEACKIMGIPSIHNEDGTLRKPFVKTNYFDFSGVNGNTEFDKRFKLFKKIENKVKIFSVEELIKIITLPSYLDYVEMLRKQTPTYECGVALQVDVDTNVLAFNNNISETDVINIASKSYNGSLLIRNHPLSSTGYLKPASLGGELDTSSNSLEFVSKCKKIYTLNSSVAFEALLFGKEVRIFGDNPFRQLQFMNKDELISALNFAVFSYLIPTTRLYDENYYSMRINCKDEEYIYNEGQKYWLK